MGFGFGWFVEFDVFSTFKFSSVEWLGCCRSRPPFSSVTFVVDVDSDITLSSSVWLRVFVLVSHCIKLMMPTSRAEGK